MEYQKIANLLDNEASNQPSKFRTRNSVETNYESRGTYTGRDIKFKTKMLRSNLLIMMHTYLLKEQKQLLVQEIMMQKND